MSWLVRYHLAMSGTAFQRDLMDPKTIDTFAALVQSPERLRLLLVLTVCDIRAVGPNVWNGWKAALLRQLYHATEQVLSGGTLSGGRGERIKQIQGEVAKRLPAGPTPRRKSISRAAMRAYWLSFDPGTLAREAELVGAPSASASRSPCEHRIDGKRSVTEVTIYTLDTHGLFARLAGAMAISGANIVDAKIFTLANGMALDAFWIQDLEGKPFDGPQRLARLAARVEIALSNRLDIQRELDSQRSSWPKRDRVFTVEPRVLIDNNASDTFTVIEVNGRDRPGFLHVVTRALDAHEPADRLGPHHHLRRARRRRVLREGPVRPEGREPGQAQAGRRHGREIHPRLRHPLRAGAQGGGEVFAGLPGRGYRAGHIG